MELKHTKGDWEAWLENCKYGVTGMAAAMGYRIETQLEKHPDYHGLYVRLAASTGVCVGVALGNTPEEARANAKLMAASADLLEAAMRVIDEETDRVFLPGAIQNLRDAVDKATK